MKNIKQFVGLILMILTLSTTYGCEFKTKNYSTSPLIVQAVDPDLKETHNTVKIALLLDTSNSMDGLINQAKSQLWDIVNNFTHAKCENNISPKLQIALYQYGNDQLSSHEGYIQQVLGFSEDLDEISEKLFSLTTNGGEEYCGEVIDTSLQQLDWGKNPDNLKMIFIAGNEPFTQGKFNYKDATTRAKDKDVIVNTIFCGNYEEGINSDWKNGAKLTGGAYIAINHNRQITHIDTPYDHEIMAQNKKLNQTYITYGKLGKYKMKNQYTQDGNAAGINEEIAVKRAVSKSSRLYRNASWDLVDAAENEDFDIEKIDQDHLPKELQGKASGVIIKEIKKKKAERTQVQQKIQELNQKRQAYIKENQNKQEKGGLENAMLEAIKQQAKKKNYSWN